MELSSYVEGLQRELASLTRFASDDVVSVAESLAEGLDSSVRLTLLDVLSAAAAEITSRLDDVVIDVRLTAGDAEFVVTDVPQPPAEHPSAPDHEAAADEAGTARVTLRLSEAIKTRIESQAASEGISVNAWLAHAAIRALESPNSRAAGRSSRRGPGGQRITGFARS